MRSAYVRSGWLFALILGVSLACNYRPVQPATGETPSPSPIAEIPATDAPPSGIAADRLLTVCLGQEPASLFLYADGSVSARAIRQAIYDGPYDWVNYEFSPVILESKPTQGGGGVSLSPVSVQPGDGIVDISGKVVRLGEGVSYYPAGCADASCAAVYGGQEPVQIDQMSVRFKLRSGIQWSDGTALSADDSVYSYEVARALYPMARAELIDRTQAYEAVDETTVEWRGIPGYRSSAYADFFFTPLPRLAWSSTPARDLLTAEISNRNPLGWGPYKIDEWIRGDHITLTRSPNYFRSGEGLPAFEKLVFRFMPDRTQALNALLAGECDYLDETLHMELDSGKLLELQQASKIDLAIQTGTAWEHMDFGLLSATPPEADGPLPLFNARETRQAIARCIDRQRLVNELALGQSQVPDSYVLPGHPLINPDVARYSYDPSAAGDLLDAAGWKDADGSPATPRIAQGIAGVPDGTPLEFALLTTDEQEKQQAAKIIQESLAACGIRMNIDTRPFDVVFGAGPAGPVFGRNFSAVQFGWVSPVEPACFLYTTQEIPGSYPEFPRGWGGANAAGYSNPEFDRLCRQATISLPESPAYRDAHLAAQAVFANDLPAIPLYSRLKLVATRPDFCTELIDSSTESALRNLEIFNYGEGCQQ